MQGPFGLVIVRTGRGRFKLYLEGYADGASTDGGPPPRYSSVAAQPRRGFRSERDAHDHFLHLLSDARRQEYDREETAARARRGLRIPERRVLRSTQLVRALRLRAPAAAPALTRGEPVRH